jgi:glycosyltransferase A (GT-A) superfamily protein (DUF2064 family)
MTSKALVLFTKVPEPGHVKTRLTQGENALTAEDASRLYSAILLDVFALLVNVAKSLDARLYVAYTPSERGAEIRRLLSGTNIHVTFFAQEGKTVAEKIVHAFQVTFADGQDASILVFGDQPCLFKELLVQGFRSLLFGIEQNMSHLVLGPTCDGGTYLIGLTSSLRSWMSGAIDCTNTSKAVSKLLVRGIRSQIPHTLLKTLVDLDDLLDADLLSKKPLLNALRTTGVLKSVAIDRMPSQGTGLSVIIPTFKEEKTLEKVIQSLRVQQLQPKEIIVVDCGSQDRSLEIANALADRVIIAESCGRQYQENVGAMGAKGDILLFLHADTSVSPTLLESIASALSDQKVVGGGARLTYVPHKLRYRALCILRDKVSRVLGIYGMGSSFFVRRQIFNDLGGFDQEMNEEGVDMSKRLRKHGRLVMLDEVVQTSARRYEHSGFLKTLCAWGFTIALSILGVHARSIENYIWRIIR